MNSKQRIAMALNHQQPDRTPFFASFVPEIEQAIRTEQNITEYDMGVALGNDMVKSCVGLEMSFYGQPHPRYVDPWGITWQYIDNEFGTFTEIDEHPLAGDLSKIDNFQIPDPYEETQYDDFRKKMKLYGKEKWMIGSNQISIFEACWYLRGMEDFMVDLALNQDYATTLIDKVMQFPKVSTAKFIEMGADMVWFGDDIACQQNMMLSMRMWRKFFKPRLAELFDNCKRLNPNIKIAYHSCGNCMDFIDDMIEIGLDVLNPLQPMAISPFEVKKRYGDRLSLFGGVCVQQLMPNGTPAQIHQAISKLKNECGKDGGYILSPAHHIQADTSLENIQTFYEAAKQ
ncbi:MAG: hypothetical protein JEZ07_03595 [Phycisphaerae bacterium]|nr:hypothetical protein [Phycisphaerae bacterium]